MKIMARVNKPKHLDGPKFTGHPSVLPMFMQLISKIHDMSLVKKIVTCHMKGNGGSTSSQKSIKLRIDTQNSCIVMKLNKGSAQEFKIFPESCELEELKDAIRRLAIAYNYKIQEDKRNGNN